MKLGKRKTTRKKKVSPKNKSNCWFKNKQRGTFMPRCRGANQFAVLWAESATNLSGDALGAGRNDDANHRAMHTTASHDADHK